TNHPGIREHPVLVAWNEPALGNAANSPPSRFTVPRRRAEGIARSNCHRTACRRLHRDRASVMRQFARADVTLAPIVRLEANLPAGRHAPKYGGALNIGGNASAGHLDWRVRLCVADPVLRAGGFLVAIYIVPGTRCSFGISRISAIFSRVASSMVTWRTTLKRPASLFLIHTKLIRSSNLIDPDACMGESSSPWFLTQFV